MSSNLVAIKVKEEDKYKLLNECKQEFLRHHPELKGFHFTYNFIITKLVEYYLHNTPFEK